jgi:hypothetical protein
MNKIKGEIISGHGVASGKGKDPRYPEGTLKLQLPHFKKRGLDLSSYFRGTINVDIAPFYFKIKTPKYYFKKVNWSIHIPPESFYFFEVRFFYQHKAYDGMIYMPDPKTKTDHEQIPTLLELILPPISGIKMGQIISLEINDECLNFETENIS